MSFQEVLPIALGAVMKHWKPPIEWLRILYGLEQMPSSFGLYANGLPFNFERE